MNVEGEKMSSFLLFFLSCVCDYGRFINRERRGMLFEWTPSEMFSSLSSLSRLDEMKYEGRDVE